MAIKRIIFSDIDLKKLDDIIDVRSPSEYEVDHIPGAINLPVLSDKEREMIGTIYKQSSKFEAKKLGAALISKNIYIVTFYLRKIDFFFNRKALVINVS